MAFTKQFPPQQQQGQGVPQQQGTPLPPAPNGKNNNLQAAIKNKAVHDKMKQSMKRGY